MKKHSKKLALGAASLALIGGMSPIFTNNTYAYSDFPLDFSETFYTTIGPDYYTYIDLDGYDYAEDVTVRVADTSIADRYYGDEGYLPKSVDKIRLDDAATVRAKAPIPILKKNPCRFEDMICIQGKKVGETELIITIDGDTTRVPLKSVKLTPEASQVGALGDTFTGTASIEGADESLLHLDDYMSTDNVSVSIRGNQGTEYTIRSRKDSSYGRPYGRADLLWKIGEQYVDGGTEFTFFPIDVENNIDDSDETEAIAKNDTISLYMSFDNYMDEHGLPESEYLRLNNFELENGSIANLNISVAQGGSVSNGVFRTYLNIDDSSASAAVKEKLSAKLPEKVSGVTHKILTAETKYCGIRESAASAQAVGLGGNSDEYCIDFAEFVQFSAPLTLTLDASDAPELKAGYKRTYYVTMEKDGKVETIDAEYNEKAKSFTFSTNILGDFAYGYVDEFVPVVPDTGIAPQKVAMVATATFAPLAVLTLGAFIARNKKKAANKLAKKHNHFE